MFISRVPLLFLTALLLSRAGSAQDIVGSTTVDIDPDTGNVLILCETDMDDSAAAYYIPTVTCTVTANGTFYGTKTAGPTHGNSATALAAFSFTGVPGTTYAAVGTHGGTIVYEDQNTYSPGQTNYYDAYNFGYYSANNNGYETPYPGTYDWPGFGSYADLPTKQVTTGKTTDSGIRYYTPGELANIISSAQALFSSKCDTKFAQVIPSYSNAGFFSSLYSTNFIQYPPGSANIPQTSGADAQTLVYQPGRPIQLLPNFYPTKYGFPAGFQEFVLIHENVHRVTGWGDYPNQNSLSTNGNDFETKFLQHGYQNQTTITGRFTDWLTSGCPP